VRLRITKIHKRTVAHVLRYEAAEALHGFGDALLIGRNDLAQSSGSIRAESAVEPTRSENSMVTWRRSAVSSKDLGTEGVLGGSAFAFASASPRSNAMASYSAMTNRANADFLQILLRQLRQDALVDLVLAKASLILSKLHNCNARPRSQSPMSHGRAALLAITHDSAGRDGRVWAGLALASPPGRSVRPATSSLGPRKTQQRPALSQRGPLR
jgi:hypothetical protein